jgi:hypothetical protein
MGGPCAVCGQPIPSDSARRVTCGHPRCRRTYARRGTSVNDYRPPTIAARVRRAIDIGLTEREALEVVSRLTGEPVAVVRSLWKGSTEAVAS